MLGFPEYSKSLGGLHIKKISKYLFIAAMTLIVFGIILSNVVKFPSESLKNWQQSQKHRQQKFDRQIKQTLNDIEGFLKRREVKLLAIRLKHKYKEIRMAALLALAKLVPDALIVGDDILSACRKIEI